MLSQGFGPFLLIAALFVIVGVGMAISTVWGLVTGGPRAKDRPGAPFLYDRLYYLNLLVVLAGWWIAMLSFFGATANAAPDGFLIGWGIMAVATSPMLLFREKMMMDGSQYLAAHGFPLFRFLHAMRVQQFERQPVFLRKLVAVIFLIVGIGVLAFNLPQIARVPEEVRSGAEGIVLSFAHLAGLTDRS